MAILCPQCGEPVKTPYCGQCGAKATLAGPLGDLLQHLKTTVASKASRLRGYEQRGTVTHAVETTRRSLKKWTARLIAFEELLAQVPDIEDDAQKGA